VSNAVRTKTNFLGVCSTSSLPPAKVADANGAKGSKEPSKRRSDAVAAAGKDAPKAPKLAAKPSSAAKAADAAKPADDGKAAKGSGKDGGRAADFSTTRLHVGKLTRNVTAKHVEEIFGTFGKLKGVDLAIDRAVRHPASSPALPVQLPDSSCSPGTRESCRVAQCCWRLSAPRLTFILLREKCQKVSCTRWLRCAKE